MPPEIFIGTDIVEILRIRELIDVHPKRFLQHTYTDQEQLYCAGKSNSFIHYAGRFAAKEAIKKALLSSKIINNISLKSIEIQNNDFGAPVIFIYSKDIDIDPEKLTVSISHAGEYATSTAIFEL